MPTVTLHLDHEQIVELSDSLARKIGDAQEKIKAWEAQLTQLQTARGTQPATSVRSATGRLKRGSSEQAVASVLNGTPKTAKEISRAVGVSIPTAHRVLATLTANAFAKKSGTGWIRNTI